MNESGERLLGKVADVEEGTEKAGKGTEDCAADCMGSGEFVDGI